MNKNLSVGDLLVLSCEKMELEGYPSSSIKATKALIKAISANEGWGEKIPFIGKKLKERANRKKVERMSEAVGHGVTKGAIDAIHEKITSNTGKELKHDVKEAEEHNWISRHPIASTAIGAGAGAAVVGGAVYMGHHSHSNEGFGLDPDLFN